MSLECPHDFHIVKKEIPRLPRDMELGKVYALPLIQVTVVCLYCGQTRRLREDGHVEVTKRIGEVIQTPK